MHILETACNAVFPIVLLIFLGYLLRRNDVVDATFVKTGNKLSFHLFLPCMLFLNVYGIEGLGVIRWDVVLYSVIMILVIFLLSMATAGFFCNVPNRRGVLLQAAFRSNMAIIGLPLSDALGGPEAVAVAAIVSAFSIPVMNVLAVVALSMYVDNEGRKPSIRSIVRNILKNPLIIAIFLGVVCLAIRELEIQLFGEVVFSLREDGKVLYICLNNLKAVASPFALLVLGGQFEFGAAKCFFREILAGTLLRVVISPLIAIGTAVLLTSHIGILNFGCSEYPALIALFGTPVAVSTAIMAGQMGNDEQLATQLVVWSSVASIATMFLTVCLLMAGGYLAL